MSNDEPMRAERLADMKGHHRMYGGIRIGELLAEVERQHAVITALSQAYQTSIELHESEIADLRQIVRVVAEADNSDSGVCYQLCPVRWYGGETDAETMEMRHDAPCVVEQARKLLASESEAQQQAKEHTQPRPMLRAVISRSCDIDKHKQCEIPEQCVCWCHRESEGE